ncbi:DODA-type extradiol aromatic ring-opening family dioxygenase [Gorillibacterium massiliense]|uniref:DODA-type extradiol aromatic ring-opening family dioxygenase n=1 Tax=Gorillibacterium massiliense TaxID=1280390 RepID=UPI0004AC7BB6|nr:class III extradiol ring-cleavage dioxygenase [Gorillibacterium massiliense]
MIPSLFICHGSPMLALEDSEYTRFLAEAGKKYRPKAIVIFSAHWEERQTTVSFAEGTLETIYDFGGFPDELYRLTYPAQGSPELAEKVEERFRLHGIPTKRDHHRGLDHGAWVILRHMYPDSDIPVVSVSVNPYFSTEEQVRIGEALKSLGNDDILVIGSGASVHNFNEIKFRQEQPEPWAMEFDSWIADKVVNRDTEKLLQYDRLAPHARRAVPRAEHFIPLFHAYGSSSGAEKPQVIFSGYQFGTFSHLCLQM